MLSEAQPRRAASAESRWPLALTMGAAIAAHLLLARDLSIEPSWLLPGAQAVTLAALLLGDPTRPSRSRSRQNYLHLALASLLSAATVLTVWRLVDALLHGSSLSPDRLLADAFVVWLSSAVAFSLWYWELDAGGPSARAIATSAQPPAFLFPQQATRELAPDWRPRYVDYLYLSFTNQTAFSPTDTMPLSAWAKGLMSVQAVVSLLIGALVVARAVNIMAS